MPDGKLTYAQKWEMKDPNEHEDWKKMANPDPANLAVHGKKSKFLPLPEQKRKTLFAHLAEKSKESKIPITYAKKTKDNGLEEMLNRIKGITKV